LKTPETVPKFQLLEQAPLYAFFTVFDRGLAGFADLDLRLSLSMLIESLYVMPFTNRTFTPSAGKKFSNPLSSMRFCHFPFPTYLLV
jgi:hypothetical protein